MLLDPMNSVRINSVVEEKVPPWGAGRCGEHHPRIRQQRIHLCCVPETMPRLSLVFLCTYLHPPICTGITDTLVAFLLCQVHQWHIKMVPLVLGPAPDAMEHHPLILASVAGAAPLLPSAPQHTSTLQHVPKVGIWVFPSLYSVP